MRVPDAHLIVDGERHAALDRPLIGAAYGQRWVLDAPTVSRRHAHPAGDTAVSCYMISAPGPGRTMVNVPPVQGIRLTARRSHHA
ncbi:MAG: hypothetical protein IPM76_27770 [Chloroflexi bacterium]|nr:hypothetical protein [Chloroflexota bacterium]